MPALRISTFGFDSFELMRNYMASLPALAEFLIESLRKKGRPRNVIFIAHGIAGLVVKCVLSTYSSTQGYLSPGAMFLGLPVIQTQGEWASFVSTFLQTTFKPPQMELPRRNSKLSKLKAEPNGNAGKEFKFLQLVDRNLVRMKKNGWGPSDMVYWKLDDMDVVRLRFLLTFHPYSNLINRYNLSFAAELACPSKSLTPISSFVYLSVTLCPGVRQSKKSSHLSRLK